MSQMDGGGAHVSCCVGLHGIDVKVCICVFVYSNFAYEKWANSNFNDFISTMKLVWFLSISFLSCLPTLERVALPNSAHT